MNPITRSQLTVAQLARGAVIALTLALIWAAPAAAAPPTRIVRPPHTSVLPAGTACAFDVKGEPLRGTVMVTDHGDGGVVFQDHAEGQYTNLATGTTFVVREAFRNVDRFDPATGIDLGMLSGQFEFIFVPGDQGPFGVVGSDGAFYRFVGTATYTWDASANRLTRFEYSGTVTDVCAALS